jgi:hypothetical protein
MNGTFRALQATILGRANLLVLASRVGGDEDSSYDGPK